MLAARRGDELAGLAAEIAARGGETSCVTTDVSVAKDVEKDGLQIYDSVLTHSVHTRRAGRPEEIARSIVFLCSDEASYITGTTLTPDRGFTLTI